MERSRDLFLFRLNRLAAVAGRPLIRLCEGKYGITRREWRLIVVLAQDGPLLSTELARRASIEPARTSRAVSILVDRGFATRVHRPNDRRYVEIGLTLEGRRVYDSAFPTVAAINEHMLECLSVAEREELEKLFHRLEISAECISSEMTDLPKANRRRART